MAPDTIVALSTGALPSGVAIVRLSGPQAITLVEAVVRRSLEPRRLSLVNVTLGGEVIDRGLAVCFPAPASFTGEPCAELHLHGSKAVVRAVLRGLTAHSGVRLAEAGEFTRRAFENGRLDLTEIEGIGDLLGAETENQRRQAVERAAGGLTRQVAAWRTSLLGLRAELEAQLDFADEGDVGPLLASFAAALAALRESLQSALEGFERGRLTREGLRVAIGGPPNAGKSSLLNALARSDVAIVSDEPGTTRDVREVAIDLGGQLVVLVDMAGIRETTSPAEAEGIRRAREELTRADLVLWLYAPDAPALPSPDTAGTPVWRVGTKLDLERAPQGCDLHLSALTGAGLDVLLERLGLLVDGSSNGEPSLLSHERDRAALTAAATALQQAQNDLGAPELAAEALRLASATLERLIGTLDAEMVLDRLFSAFCIGK